MDRRLRSASDDPTRRFLAEVLLIVTVGVVLAMWGVYARTSSLIEDTALATARSYTDLVVAARSWNASHGGVWVVKETDADTNPFLVQMGVSADATTTDGRVLTLNNPAIMTEEISDALRAADGTFFRLTSIKPIDPDNAPDEWERASFVAFDSGAKERWASAEVNGTPVLRYMRPLVTDASCLTCHAHQGYHVGDVRGAVSVLVPLSIQHDQAILNTVLIGGLGVLATIALIAVTLTRVRHLRGQLDTAQATLVEAATVDPLTGVATRRHTMLHLEVEIDRAARTRDPVALVMIDIDHFKLVNDAHGHAAGDAVLTEVSRRIGDTLRPYDIFGRIGGEEFLIVSPETGLDEAMTIAERARLAVSASPIDAGQTQVTVTVSLGVTLVDPAEGDALDHALARVDDALYDAKEAGRDRTGMSGPAG